MAFNFYDTHTLLASVQQLPPLHSFLLDRYFPTNAASDVFATDDVLVEYRKGSKKAAPFVAPRKGGITILREGYIFILRRMTRASIRMAGLISIGAYDAQTRELLASASYDLQDLGVPRVSGVWTLHRSRWDRLSR